MPAIILNDNGGRPTADAFDLGGQGSIDNPLGKCQGDHPVEISIDETRHPFVDNPDLNCGRAAFETLCGNGEGSPASRAGPHFHSGRADSQIGNGFHHHAGDLDVIQQDGLVSDRRLGKAQDGGGGGRCKIRSARAVGQHPADRSHRLVENRDSIHSDIQPGGIPGSGVVAEGDSIRFSHCQSSQGLRDGQVTLQESRVVLLRDQAIIRKRAHGIVHPGTACSRPGPTCCRRQRARGRRGSAGFKTGIHHHNLSGIARDEANPIEQAGGIAGGNRGKSQRAIGGRRGENHIPETVGRPAGARQYGADRIQRDIIPLGRQIDQTAIPGVIKILNPITLTRNETGDPLTH